MTLKETVNTTRTFEPTVDHETIDKLVRAHLVKTHRILKKAEMSLTYTIDNVDGINKVTAAGKATVTRTKEG